MKKFYIIDGNAYIHRAYHALPPLSTSDGLQVNAIFGFVKLLLKIKENFKPGYIAVCFDYPAKNFRHNIFKEYKAQRKPLDPALIEQMPIARQAVEALNIKKLEIEGYEADDLIASLVEKNKESKIDTVITTGDKDIMQLVSGEEVLVWNDSKEIMFGDIEVEQKFGVKPEQIIDLFSLMGDASDNVPGIKGIGEKTAVKLIKEFGTLENILANAKNVKGKLGQLLLDGREDALMSRELITLNKIVPFDYDLNSFENKPIDKEKLEVFFKTYEFKSLIEKFCRNKDSDNADAVDKTTSEAQYLGGRQGRKSNTNGVNINQVLPAFNYEIINSVDRLKELVSIICKQEQFAVKTIINAEKFIVPSIVGAAVSVGAGDENKSYYIALSHNTLTDKQLNFKEFKEIFEPIIASDKIKKIACDLKLERNIYKKADFVVDGLFFDCSIASYCLNTSKSHDIKTMAQDYFNFDAGDDSFLGKASKKISFADSQIEQTANFACRISFITLELFKVLKKDIDSALPASSPIFVAVKNINEDQVHRLFYNIEMPILSILSDMEIAGIKADKTFLRSFDEKISTEILDVEKRIFETAGAEFNINSQKQLSEVLFQKLNLPSGKKTKTGYSTDEEVLSELALSYPFAAQILDFRQLQKLKNTYIDPILNYLSLYGDRIHTTFNQTIVFTGRLSSTDPNLQNIPIKSSYGREFRRAFIADDNCVFISADYSQIDLRALAHISKDKKLIEAFNSGKDIHSATAREVFGIAENEEIPKNLRDAAKSINFGIIYGISPFGLSKQLNISREKSKNYIDSYLERYSGVKKWTSEIVKQAERDGYISTITGRVRFVSNILSRNKQIAQASQRVVLNTPIQGASADIIKIAMINIAKELKRQNFKSKILLQVHDDLLFEVPENEIEKILPLIKDKMQSAVKLDVPLIVDIKTGKNWGQMSAIK